MIRLGNTILRAIRRQICYADFKGENMQLKKTLKKKKKIDVASARLRQIEEAKLKVATERADAEERFQNLKKSEI